MPVKDDNKRLSLTLSKELDEKLEVLAGLQNISKNAVIVNLIEMSLDAQINFWKMMKNKDLFQKLVDLTEKMGSAEDMKNLDIIKEYVNGNDPDKLALGEQLTEEFEKIKK